ncbi:hypothetical protein PTKIN_Ptkin17bG0063600 [Pterospermum kingtungense]
MVVQDLVGMTSINDRATGEEAEASGDVVENIEVEKATAKVASEAYNAMNNGESFDGYFIVNLENVSESMLFANTGNSESSTSTGRRPTMKVKIDMARKKQKTKRNSEIDKTFLKIMAKLGEICEGAKKEIGKFASCFQHLAENAKRKMQVYDVIDVIEGLTDEDAIKVVVIISTDIDKTNVLFSILDCMKKLYVQ